MRIALVLSLILAAAACGKKKAPQAPSNTAPASEAAPAGDDMKEKDAPAPGDESKTRSADPCEGGE